MRKNPLIWLALLVVVACTMIGVNGHAWVALVGDAGGIILAIGAKLLERRRKRARGPRTLG